MLPFSFKKNRPWTQTATNAMFLVNTNLTTPYLAGSMLVAGMAITVPQRVRTSTRCVAFLWSFLSSATICNFGLKDPVKMICRVSSYTITLVILYILVLKLHCTMKPVIFLTSQGYLTLRQGILFHHGALCALALCGRTAAMTSLCRPWVVSAAMDARRCHDSWWLKYFIGLSKGHWWNMR